MTIDIRILSIFTSKLKVIPYEKDSICSFSAHFYQFQQYG